MAFRFRKLNVYQEAKALHRSINSIVNKFPRSFYYLADQARRASLSIVLNIAEGSSKQSDRDFNRFIAMSLGSLDELMACFEIALEEKIITAEEFKTIENKCEKLSLQLGSFSKKLRASSE